MKLLSFSWVFLVIVLSGCGGNDVSEDDAQNNTNDTTGLVLTFDQFAEKSLALEAKETNLDSIYNWFQSNKGNFTPEEKDSSALIYLDLMERISFDTEADYEGQEEMEKQFSPYGFNIGGGEGVIWLIVNSDEVGKKFQDDISQDLREYLRLGEITGKQYASDGGMTISYEEWGKVLIDLEDRVKANRESKYYSRFLETYQEFLSPFLWGMDNTPITDWETGYLNEEVKAAYTFLIDDKEHRTGEIVRVHWFDFEMGGPESAMRERWIPGLEEIEYYFYGDLKETE